MCADHQHPSVFSWGRAGQATTETAGRAVQSRPTGKQRPIRNAQGLDPAVDERSTTVQPGHMQGRCPAVHPNPSRPEGACCHMPGIAARRRFSFLFFLFSFVFPAAAQGREFAFEMVPGMTASETCIGG